MGPEDWSQPEQLPSISGLTPLSLCAGPVSQVAIFTPAQMGVMPLGGEVLPASQGSGAEAGAARSCCLPPPLLVLRTWACSLLGKTLRDQGGHHGSVLCCWSSGPQLRRDKQCWGLLGLPREAWSCREAGVGVGVLRVGVQGGRCQVLQPCPGDSLPAHVPHPLPRHQSLTTQ